MSIKPPGLEEFTEDQKQYLDGFFFGVRNRGVGFSDVAPDPVEKRTVKQTDEEKIKAEQHPFDAFPRLQKNAASNSGPGGGDAFRFKWNGLFWLNPVHNNYMCRLRIPAGQLNAQQLRGFAQIADDCGGGFGQFTTRNNLQIRDIEPEDAPELLRRIQEIGLHHRGSGGDNIRNFTSSPLAGIDPFELIDTTPHVKDLAQMVINSREFYDLPRKFNISFDGGGVPKIAEDTNDIGFRAIRLKVPPEGHPLRGKLEGGTYFQILLGGVTGHGEFAEDSGVVCAPEQSVEIAAEILRVFVANGDRSSRKKARMVYLIKKWGFERFITETEKGLGFSLPRFDLKDPEHAALLEPVEKPDRPHPHLGAFPQAQEGMSYLGIYIEGGLAGSDRLRAIAEIAETYGSGDLRLTIYQNVIVPNIPDGKMEEAKAAVRKAGLHYEASFLRGGLATCTGNRWCKYSSADTKGHGLALVGYLETQVALDQPINIHVTGCPHSCAQHYIGDLGLLACKVERDGEAVEGFHVFVGGGFGGQKRVGRQLFKALAAGAELNENVAKILRAYLDHRLPGETFQGFTCRHEIEQLTELAT